MVTVDGTATSWHGNRLSASYQTERLITVSRLVLAAFVILAAGFQPLWISDSLHIEGWLRSLYLGFASILVVLSWSHCHWFRFLGWISHIVDLACLGLIFILAENLTDFHYVHILFPVATASLRWGWQGMLVTLLAVFLVYSGLQLTGYGFNYGDEPFAELPTFLHLAVLAGHLLAVFLLLGYLAYQYNGLRQEIIRLADWPRDVPDDALSSSLLHTVAAIFQTSRVIMIWDEPDESWLNLAYYHDAQVVHSRESPTAFQPLVATALSEKHFLCQNLNSKKSTLVYDDRYHQHSWRGIPLNAVLQQRYAISAVLALRLHSEDVDGWLLVLDREDLGIDDLLLGEIVARQATVDLGKLYQQRALPKADLDMSDETVQLAHNLHDGLLQSLTSIALKLQAVQVQWQHNPEAAQLLLTNLQEAVANEQRELRRFVDIYKPFLGSIPSTTEITLPLVERLRTLTRRISRDWPTLVESAIRPNIVNVPTELEDDLYYIVQEALINAARHSSCTRIYLSVNVRDPYISIIVEDDGKGFPFHGHYTLTQLCAMGRDPVSLSSRIRQLNGQLILDSSNQGSRLEIQLSLKRNP